MRLTLHIMPTINTIAVSLDGGREVYRPGEVVSGCWTLDIGEALTVRGIRTYLHGAAYTRWRPFDVRKNERIGYELITRQVCTVVGKQENERGPNPTVEAGVHQYRFSFQLPDHSLPSSYEGEYGAIRYWVALQIDRHWLRFNIDRFKTITVLDTVIDINAPEYCNPIVVRREEKISKVLGIGNQGSVTIDVSINRGGFCPGEKIIVSMSAKNSSTKDLGKIRGCLIQSTKFLARSDGILGGSDEEQNTDIELRSINDKVPLLKNTERVWRDIPLTIEAVPPTTRIGTCHIVVVSYSLRINIEMSLLQGGDISLYIPVVVGTVPQGNTFTTSPVPHSLELDLSSLITYTQCNKGFDHFTKSCDDFPEDAYQPYCAYNQNFRLKEPLKTVMASRSITPGANNSEGSSSDLDVTPLRDALAEVATDAASCAADIGMVQSVSCRPQNSASVQVSGRKSFLLLRFSSGFYDDFQLILKETQHVLGGSSGNIIALAKQVSITKGDVPSETSVAIFLFDADDKAVRYFEEINRKCCLYCFDIDEAIVGVTKADFNRGKPYFNLSYASKVPSANYQSSEWKRYLILAGKQLISLRKALGGVRLTDTKQRRLTSAQSRTTVTITQWDTYQQISDYFITLENDSQYKELTDLRDLFFSVKTTLLFKTEHLDFMT